MDSIGGFALRTRTSLGFEEAIEKITGLLQEQGFGILTEIDVQATLKAKLGINTSPYRILGACNPPFAHRALEAEPLVGVLLPCNVVVWDEGDSRVVAALEPNIMAKVIDNETLGEVAREVSARIKTALTAFEQG
ncbi:MAG TPA: DUF302 domain-containing protein [Bacteroidetes bacterium]|nr:DUF302 domain-containing protein [Bacteroidota bacterium]